MKTLKSQFLLFSISILLLCNLNCKDKITLNPIKEELPAITQKGANTFGFLLNGEVWLPKTPLLQERLDLTYDPNYKGGSFGIIANRYLSSTDKMELRIGCTGLNKVGVYNLTQQDNNVIYRDYNNGCNYIYDTNISGTLTITKVDLTQKFISGIFSFKLEKQGCPTLNASEGRFDLKIE